MNPKLMIVIHAEEEFNWDGGFYRSNTNMTHANELIAVVDQILELGGKVTFAMDYPFITSDGGKKVVENYRDRCGDNIEFATHLHPWVSPPYENSEDAVSETSSYPGNLPTDVELAKLRQLTDKIEEMTGTRPTSYLAGRYGIGESTPDILKKLGYTVDLSISSYCDFTHQAGPDFSRYTNECFEDKEITYIPHTSSILSALPVLSRYLNKRPRMFTQIQSNRLSSLIGKVLRVRRYRLSPEGFNFRQMAEMTRIQMQTGQEEFLLSFHSPSTKPGLTPYVNDTSQLNSFCSNLYEYIEWFSKSINGTTTLPKELQREVE